MVVAVVMALVVGMVRGNLFDGGRHLHGKDASAAVHQGC